MTGEKDRYTTTEKLWKLDDKTLSTPEHDEMVLWLLDKKNISALFKRYELNTTTFVNTWVFSDIFKDLQDDRINFVYSAYKDSKRLLDVNDELVKLYSFMKDFDILSDEDVETVVDGFFSCSYVHPSGWKERAAEFIIGCRQEIEDVNQFWEGENFMAWGMCVKSEVPITANNGFLVGYCDVEIEFSPVQFVWRNLGFVYHNDLYNDVVKEYIEVKPKIRSFGETLRQLRTYEHYLGKSPVLFTNDTRFEEAFSSQNIEVLTYPKSSLFDF